MATRKKAKSRAKRKKTPTRKTAARKTASRAGKKPARKKPAARRAAPRRAPAPRAAAAQPTRPAAAPRPDEERIGVVTHYYSHLSVAVVRLESGGLKVGDTIHISGHTSDFRQRVESMQIEHESISEATAGDEFGLKVREHAREHDVVYKVGR